MIVPDLSPNAPSSYYITEAWTACGDIERHLTVCIVSVHKLIKCIGNIHEHQSLLLIHQASAASKLQSMISAATEPQLDVQLFQAANMFLYAQIQQSAYGPWRTHLQGAKALIGSRQETILGRYDFAFFSFCMVDIYGTTMAPSRLLSKEMIAEHMLYLELVGRLDVDVPNTLTPIPSAVVEATITINIHRIARSNGLGATNDPRHQNMPSPSAVLASLQQFDATRWARGLPSDALTYSIGWVALAQGYQAATMLHLFQSGLPLASIGIQNNIRWVTYRTLITAIKDLFDQRLHGGTHHKFMLWPMVVCGIEAAFRMEREDLDFLRDSLETMTLDLGSLTMRGAAAFLKNVSKHCENRLDHLRRDHLEDSIAVEWDKIFDCAPVFIV